MAELRECPFCGGKAVLYGQVFYYIVCKSCLAETKGNYSKQTAIEAWNRRYTPSEIEITPYEVGDTIRIPLPKDKKIMTYEGEEIDFDYEAED